MTATDSSLEKATAPAVTPVTSNEYPDAVRMALGALAVAVATFFLCHLPYGRLMSVFLSLGACALAGLSLLGLERRVWLGWVGIALNTIMLALLVGFPGVFGLTGWWPVRASEVVAQTPGMTADGWVDAALAGWEKDGVQVGLTFATVGPDPAQPRGRSGSYLWIGVVVTNKGTQTIDFDPWDATASNGPALATADGRAVPGRRSAKANPTKLAPGKSAECLLSFEVPPTGQALKLELPARNFGGSTPARFQIAHELILRK